VSRPWGFTKEDKGMPFIPMRSPRVYVPSKSHHDFSDASRYGTLVWLTEGPQNRFELNNMYRHVASVMADAQSGDYLLITGPTTVNVIAASILANRFGRINYLIFNAWKGKYVSVPIVLEQKEGIDVRAASRA
jgi:hypothetical protein